MNTTENNKLIAEFMGRSISPITLAEFRKLKPRDKHLVSGAFVEDLQYHSDWNWLMEVVEKIEQLRYVTEISGNIERKFTCIAYPNTSEEYISRIGYGKEMFLNKKYVTYQAVVAFIKWYNEQK